MLSVKSFLFFFSLPNKTTALVNSEQTDAYEANSRTLAARCFLRSCVIISPWINKLHFTLTCWPVMNNKSQPDLGKLTAGAPGWRTDVRYRKCFSYGSGTCWRAHIQQAAHSLVCNRVSALNLWPPPFEKCFARKKHGHLGHTAKDIFSFLVVNRSMNWDQRWS